MKYPRACKSAPKKEFVRQKFWPMCQKGLQSFLFAKFRPNGKENLTRLQQKWKTSSTTLVVHARQRDTTPGWQFMTNYATKRYRQTPKSLLSRSVSSKIAVPLPTYHFCLISHASERTDWRQLPTRPHTYTPPKQQWKVTLTLVPALYIRRLSGIILK